MKNEAFRKSKSIFIFSAAFFTRWSACLSRLRRARYNSTRRVMCKILLPSISIRTNILFPAGLCAPIMKNSTSIPGPQAHWWWILDFYRCCYCKRYTTAAALCPGHVCLLWALAFTSQVWYWGTFILLAGSRYHPKWMRKISCVPVDVRKWWTSKCGDAVMC